MNPIFPCDHMHEVGRGMDSGKNGIMQPGNAFISLNFPSYVHKDSQSRYSKYIYSWRRITFRTGCMREAGVMQENKIVQFLSRDAMHKRDLCRRAVSVHPSVWVSVCPSRSCILSKRINISSTFCHEQGATAFLFFGTKPYGNIPTGTPNRSVECRWGRQKSRFWINIWLWNRWLVKCYQHQHIPNHLNSGVQCQKISLRGGDIQISVKCITCSRRWRRLPRIRLCLWQRGSTVVFISRRVL